MSKISIRFFSDREVRAIWDEANSKWWFSAIDIIRAINKETTMSSISKHIRRVLCRNLIVLHFQRETLTKHHNRAEDSGLN